jgi:hypothetical protein
MSKEGLVDIISELVDEELDEMSSTGGIAGYNTPNAFSDDEEDEKTKKNSTNSTLNKIVGENAFSGGTPQEKKAIKKRAESLGYIMIGKLEKSNNLNEAIDVNDYKEIASIIRMEVASIFYKLFKKKALWT